MRLWVSQNGYGLTLLTCKADKYMTAKPATERMAALRKRRKEAGFTRLELWLHPDDHEAVKDAAAKLQRKREKAAKRCG